jgi:epoxide hydrolase-like predicted phosphatase
VKAIVFDLGKVLVDFDYEIAARKIAARSGISLEQIHEIICRSPILFRYETGQLTTQQFFEAVCAETGFDGGIEEFSESFANIFVPIEEMVRFQSKIRSLGHPTFIFSNTNDLAVTHIRRNFPFFSNFDDYILSYQHGVMKPDERLYMVVERQSGRSGGEIVYLDDRAENIAAAVARGWHAILHQSPRQTLAAIRELGLNHEPVS